MSKLPYGLALSIIAAAFATAASAQGNPEVVATLQVNKGVVMTSTGSEYISAGSGHPLVKAERVMIAQDGSATITYSNGCKRELETPGVYVVDGICTAGGLTAAGTTALIVAGAVTAGAIANALDHNDNNQQPISR